MPLPGANQRSARAFRRSSAEKNPVVPHRKIEDRLRTSGMAWTFIRAAYFMRFGLADGLTDEVERITGQPPIPCRQFVHDTRDAWSRAGRPA